MSRIAFYDPFLEMLGGGEKVLLTIVEEVSAAGHRVELLSPAKPDLARWERLNLAVDARCLRWRAAGQTSVTPLSAGADLLVTLTNHFPPLSLARRSTAIVQFPFGALTDGGPVIGSIRALERVARLRGYAPIVCYSEFVAAEIRRRLGVHDVRVIAPPVDLPTQPARSAIQRDPAVLAVGRFFPSADANNKKHEVLIDAWRALEQRGLASGWRLHLAGGLADDPGAAAHLRALRERARGLSVDFHPNASAALLRGLYDTSSLFWHATGYGELRPERHEHFGITTVEAMAHGCVPVVVGLGGQLEIVTDGVDGRLWHTLDQLVSLTADLIESPDVRARLSDAALASSRRYGKEAFLSAVRREILQPAGIR